MPQVKIEAVDDSRGPGRPSDYDEDMPIRARTYLQIFSTLQEVVPTIEGLARFLKTNKQTIYRWAEAHPEFSDALEDIRSEQAVLLQNQGLIGKFAPVITKLMLSANHGMKEKSEQDITSGGERIQGITVEFIGKAQD